MDCVISMWVLAPGNNGEYYITHRPEGGRGGEKKGNGKIGAKLESGETPPSPTPKGSREVGG